MITSINTKTKPSEDNNIFNNFLIKFFYLMIVLFNHNSTDKLVHSASMIVIKAKIKWSFTSKINLYVGWNVKIYLIILIT